MRLLDWLFRRREPARHPLGSVFDLSDAVNLLPPQWSHEPTDAELTAMVSERQWLIPPTDVHDARAWDKYWDDQIAHGLNPQLFDIWCDDQQLVDVMMSREASTILCVGCGISQEPRVLADAGFKVTALDLSPAALRWAQAIQPRPDHLRMFFDRPVLRSGGAVRYVVGDLFDPTTCAGPFDVIIERSCVQLFGNDIAAGIQNLVSRLGNKGVFRSHCHVGCPTPGTSFVHPVQSWLEAGNWTMWNGKSGAAPLGRFAWLSMSTG